MSPLPRLHHHDIMTIVVPSIRHIYIYVPYTYRSYVRNVGALKVADLRCSRQQCSVVVVPSIRHIYIYTYRIRTVRTCVTLVR